MANARSICSPVIGCIDLDIAPEEADFISYVQTGETFTLDPVPPNTSEIVRYRVLSRVNKAHVGGVQ